MKRIVCVFIALVCLLAFPAPSNAALNLSNIPVTIHVDGYYLPCDVAPIIENGRTLLPLRAAGEALGATVDWNNRTRTATLSKDSTTVSFTIDKKNYTKNGASANLDVTPKIRQGRTLIPLRAFAEALDANVTWDGKTSDIQIDTTASNNTHYVNPQKHSNGYWLINKYYVESSATDPLVGSWEWKGDDGGFGFPNSHYYLFISNADGKYDINYIVTSDTALMMFDTSGYSSGSTATIDVPQIPTYYNGPATGFMYQGYDLYKINSESLIRTSRISYFAGQKETQSVYHSFTKF